MRLCERGGWLEKGEGGGEAWIEFACVWNSEKARARPRVYMCAFVWMCVEIRVHLSCVAKKTYMCGQRDPYVWPKKPICVAKETYMCGKRDLCVLQKRPICVAKETYVSGKQTYMCGKRDLYVWQKRPMCVAKEKHIC